MVISGLVDYKCVCVCVCVVEVALGGFWGFMYAYLSAVLLFLLT